MDVFIVLSGFVLGLVAFRAGDSLRMDNFLIRRAVRLSPPYFTALAIATVLAMSPLYSWFVAERATWTDLTWHIFFAQTWNPARLGTINGSLWSVALEAQLYLTFPLIVLIARRWGMLPIVVGAVAMSVLMSSVSWGGPVGAGFTDEHNLPIRLVQFVAGVWGAHRYVSDRLPPRLVLWAMAVLGGLAAVGWSTAAFAPGRSGMDHPVCRTGPPCCRAPRSESVPHALRAVGVGFVQLLCHPPTRPPPAGAHNPTARRLRCPCLRRGARRRPARHRSRRVGSLRARGASIP